MNAIGAVRKLIEGALSANDAWLMYTTNKVSRLQAHVPDRIEDRAACARLYRNENTVRQIRLYVPFKMPIQGSNALVTWVNQHTINYHDVEPAQEFLSEYKKHNNII